LDSSSNAIRQNSTWRVHTLLTRHALEARY
jgi:hypothetical protein